MLSLDWEKFWDSEAERCGFVVLEEDEHIIVEVPNRSSNPKDSFVISPESIAEYENRTVATWHTHCDDYANLSISDYDAFLMFPQWKHLILSQHMIVQYGVREGHVFLEGSLDR